MEVKCPRCKNKFPVKVESQAAGGRARAKLWTFEQRSKAMKKAWKTRKAKEAEKNEEGLST
jgi:phage FluMu protein Com